MALSAAPTPSHHQRRILDLADKLQGLQAGLTEERAARREGLEAQLRALEDRVGREAIAEEGNYKLLLEQVGKLHEGLRVECMARELLDERRTKELRLLESSAALELNVERQARKEGESRLVTEVEQRFDELEAELSAAAAAGARARAARAREAAAALDAAEVAVAEERRLSAENTDRISRGVRGELAKIEEELAAEAAARAEAESALGKVVADAAARLAADVAHERQEREAAEEMLLGLIEKTVAGLEAEGAAAIAEAA